MSKTIRNIAVVAGAFLLAWLGLMIVSGIVWIATGGDSETETAAPATTVTTEATSTTAGEPDDSWTEAPTTTVAPATTTTTTRPPTTTTTEPRDIIAEAACRHFFNVADDAANGLLTDAELRVKLREVMDDAEYADDIVIAMSARDMFVAITAGDMAGLEASALLMTIACEEL